MDKRRDVRRGASWFKHSDDKLVCGLNGVGGKTKGSLKRWSSVGRASVSYEDFEMGCDASEREDDLHSIGSSKRFKLPNKFFDDYSGINHVSVPRKLRSAMKKRSCESISPPLPDLKGLNHTTDVESPMMDDAKKLRSCMKQGIDRSLRQTEFPTITEDEEEVVKILYALAVGMFANNDGDDDKLTLDAESVEANASTSPESKERQLAAAEVGKLGLSSICSLPTSEVVNPSSSIERLAETIKNDSSIGIKGEDLSASLQDKKLKRKSEYSPPPINIMSTMREWCDMKLECDTVNFCIPSNLNMDSSVKPFLLQETSVLERKTEITSVSATTNDSLMEPEHMVKESKEIGLALWPGLKSTTSPYGGTDGPSLPSSVATIPAWLDASLRTLKNGSLKNHSSALKVYEVTAGRKSYKRCAAHVYICHLIQTLEISEGKDKVPLQQNCMRPQEVNLGVLLGVSKINGMKNGLNSTVSASNLGSSIAKGNADGTKHNILPERRFHQDKQVSALTYGRCTSQKQSFEFLSMSAGGSTLQASDSFGRTRTDFGQISKIQVPYLSSLMQHQDHKQMPFSLPQSQCNPVYANHLSSAQQMPLPPCHGNPFYQSPSSSPVMTKQQYQLQQPQQQQRLWSTQCRPVETSAGAIQLTNWQNAKQGLPPFISYSQGLTSPPSALEAIGHKFAPLSHQQVMSSSFYHGRIMKQDHNLPSIHEESDSKFQAAGPMPLQLLCNERL